MRGRSNRSHRVATKPVMFKACDHSHSTEEATACATVWLKTIRGKKAARELYCQTGLSVNGTRPTQYMARCPLYALHVSTIHWPTWKNTHTLNIILDDYKEMTSCFISYVEIPKSVRTHFRRHFRTFSKNRHHECEYWS